MWNLEDLEGRVRSASEGVAVVGCGRMGTAIAGELARRGLHVTVFDETDFTRQRAKHNLQAALLDNLQKGLLTSEDECKSIMNRVRVAETLEDAVGTAAVVFEAVIDDMELKRALFQRMLDAKSTAVLCSNSVKMSAKELMKGTSLQLWGCRFLLPVWFVDDVEVDAGGLRGDRLSPLLAALGFKVTYYKGERLRIPQEVVRRYVQEQRAVVERERQGREYAERERENLGQERAADDASTREADVAIDVGDADELCVVCLDAARSALIKPCGHTSTCMACARKLPWPRQCPTCRRAIEDVLPWRDL